MPISRAFRLFVFLLAAPGATLPVFGVQRGVQRIWYDPLAPSKEEQADIKLHASFSDPEGIQEIVIKRWVGPIVAAGPKEGLPAGLPTWEGKPSHAIQSCPASGARGKVETCDFDLTPRPNEDSTLFENDLLVSFVAWYVPKNPTDPARGKEDSFQGPLAFAVGDPETSRPPAKYRSMAWPVLWHQMAELDRKIDLGFTRPSYLFKARQRVREVVNTTFDPATDFARVMAERRDDFNFWMMAPATSYNRDRPCEFWVHKETEPATHFLDGLVLVHEEPVLDCGTLGLGYGGNGLGGRASVFTHWTARGEKLDSPSALILTHEMGHFLFEQSDEYERVGSYRPEADCANVRRDPERCLSDLEGAPGPKTARRCDALDQRAPRTHLWRSLGEIGEEVMRVSPYEGRPSPIGWGLVSERCVKERLAVFPERVANVRPLVAKESLGPDQEPVPPSGVEGILVTVRTCRKGREFWFVPVDRDESGREVLAGKWRDGCQTPPASHESCNLMARGSGGPLPLSIVSIAPTLRTPRAEEGAADSRRSRGPGCTKVLKLIAGKEAFEPAQQQGPCAPSLAVEGAGLFEGVGGQQLVLTLAAPRGVAERCLVHTLGEDVNHTFRIQLPSR